MNAVVNYFGELSSRFGAAWNRFWFTPVDPIGVSLLRPLVGAMTLWFLLTYTTDLITWFGPDGLLPIDTVRQLTSDDTDEWNGRLSYLNGFDDPGMLMTAHIAAIIIAAAFTAGFATRVTNILALVIVLSYVHRGPLITGQFEPLLTLLLFYLCLGPCHRRFSVDSWLQQRRARRTAGTSSKAVDSPSVTANISQRLIQVHIAAMYLMMGLTKLGGSDAWWAGEAIWWLVAHTESRIIDLTFLHQYEYLVNLWTHGVVVLELSFGLLIWQRLVRPLLLVLAVVHWVMLGLVTGLVSFSAIMLVANLSFITPEAVRAAVVRVKP